MHGSGPPLDPYPRDDAVVEAPLRDTPPSPARSKASRSNSPGSFELDDFLEKDEAYRAIMSETMGDGLAQNFLFDDSPPRQPSESPPRQEQPPPQQRTFNGKQPPAQKPPPPDYVDDARPPRTAAEATRRAASLAARYHGVVADDLLPEGEAPEVYAAAIAGAYRDEAAAAAASRPRYATRSRDRRDAAGGWAAVATQTLGVDKARATVESTFGLPQSTFADALREPAGGLLDLTTVLSLLDIALLLILAAIVCNALLCRRRVRDSDHSPATPPIEAADVELPRQQKERRRDCKVERLPILTR